eukprot:TCONS_00017591-protein
MTSSLRREYAAWQRVLNEFCHPQILQEYGQFEDDTSRMKFLDCMRGSLINQMTTHSLDGGKEGGDKTYAGGHTISAQEKRILVQAYKLFGCSSKMNHEFYAMIKDQLSHWAIPKPIHDVIWRHNFTIFHTKFKEASVSNKSHIMTTDAAVVKETNKNGVDFSKLTKVRCSSLKLFHTAKGKYIEGKIVVAPVIFVGITTIIEDDFGDHAQVTFYNMIQSTDNRWELAEAKFPIGGRIRVAEPFYKVFQDGNRGIRVDSPTEVQILGGENPFDMTEIRERGKALMLNNEYIAALDVYVEASKHFSCIPTLLNNRCQAEIRLEQYEEALLDVAAVLFLDEANPKAKQRYEVAFSKLKQIYGDDCQLVWKAVLENSHVGRDALNATRGSKEEGNTAFREGRFEEAKRQYTGALNDKDVCTLLNNIAIVCLKTDMFQSSISAANVTLRIAKNSALKQKATFAMTKAFSMLGELDMAELSGRGDESLEDFWNESRKPMQMLLNILECLPQFANIGWKPTYTVGLEGKNLPIDYCVSEAMEHGFIPGRGRGLIARRDIFEHEVLIVDRMICSKRGDHGAEDGVVFSMNTKTHVVEYQQKRKLVTKILELSKYDGSFAKKLLCLENQPRQAIFEKLPLISD